MIGRSGERGSGISVQAARHDDDKSHKIGKKDNRFLKPYILQIKVLTPIKINFESSTNVVKCL